MGKQKYQRSSKKVHYITIVGHYNGKGLKGKENKIWVLNIFLCSHGNPGGFSCFISLLIRRSNGKNIIRKRQYNERQSRTDALDFALHSSWRWLCSLFCYFSVYKYARCMSSMCLKHSLVYNCYHSNTLNAGGSFPSIIIVTL